MKLSTRARYGIRALVELALHQGEGPIILKEIAHNQRISLQYLEHLLKSLIAGGIVLSYRGARGGITLAKPPEQIKLSEVVKLLEGSVAPVDCVDNPETCDRSGVCAARDIWCEVSDAISRVLESTTLLELAGRQKEKQLSGRVMYHI